MIDIIAIPLGATIRVMYNLVGHNYLIALLLFTVLTKLILFPLMLKQLKSTQAIQKIAPEDKRLREKYKDDQQKLAEEISKLYAENKVNPLAGCLVPLIQIPIILAMFWVIKQPLTYVLHMDQAQINNYTATYLNVEVDQVTEKIAKNYEINVAKEYQDEIGLDMNVGNINLGDVPKDAFSKDESKRVSKLTLLIPVLSLIFAIISQKVTQKSMQMTEDQAEMQKSMNLMMPLLSAYIAVMWPVALGLYWLFGNVLSIIQQFIMDKLMEDDSEPKNNNKNKNKLLFLGKGENND